MRCDEFEGRLNAVLDERRRPEWDAELQAHCTACGECRQLADRYDAILDAFYEMAAPPAPHDMAQRVLDDMRVQPRRARQYAVAAALLATAAAVLIAVGPEWLGNSPTQQQGAGNQQAGDARLAAPGHAKHGPAQHGRQVADLLALAGMEEADPYAGLAKETGQGLATVMLYVPGIGGSRGIIDAEDEVGGAEPAWAVQMSEGLKPITDSVTETLNLLLRSLPVAQSAARS